MSFFNSSGFDIHYSEEKGISKKDVLFIHGNLASNEWWSPTIELMKDKKSDEDLTGKVVCAEWRGYGKSKGLKDKSEINFEIYADDYIKLIEDRGMKNVDVVGHSTGGYIAVLAVLKRPDLFRSCFFLDSVGLKGLNPGVPTDMVLAHFDKMSQDKTYCKQVMAATIDGVDTESPVFNKLFEIAWDCDKVCWTGVIEVLCGDIDLTSEVKEKWSTPSMIVHGEKDVVLPLKDSKELHEALPNSKFQALENQGHSCNMENPERFYSLLKSFWSSLEL